MTATDTPCVLLPPEHWPWEVLEALPGSSIVERLSSYLWLYVADDDGIINLNCPTCAAMRAAVMDLATDA